MNFQKVAILGGGLLGGSLALRLQGVTRSTLWARRESSVKEAQSLGLTTATGDLREALDGADLVILSVPVGAMPSLLSAAIEAGLSKDCLISDVGSVKQTVHQSLRDQLEEGGFKFIGGHPMAGSESKGLSAARHDLFEGSACLLTDDFNVGEPWANHLESFWSELGCRVRWMSSADHDQLVARISHFPHIMAAATARVSMKSPDDSRYGGGGLRDTTRVAGGDPDMWAEILMENAPAVIHAVREAHNDMGEMLAMMESGDHEALLQWLKKARELKYAGNTEERG